MQNDATLGIFEGVKGLINEESIKVGTEFDAKMA
jgi:hypothetical protein